MNSWLAHQILESDLVKLIPLEKEHTKALLEAASDGELWNIWYASIPTPDAFNAYIDHALSQREKGLESPYVVYHKPSKRIVGCTRYYGATPEHSRLEIGYTWYAKSFQRTGVNTACKLLLLSHAFETLDCIAVQLMTNWHNHRSRAAMLRLGAKQDGILRHHRVNFDGTYRDSVVFSITNKEWPEVKKNLEDKQKSHN